MFFYQNFWYQLKKHLREKKKCKKRNRKGNFIDKKLIEINNEDKNKEIKETLKQKLRRLDLKLTIKIKGIFSKNKKEFFM